MRDWLANVRQDLVFGLRMMARQPGFTAMAVLALVIGIGFVAGQFIVLNGFLLRPLPFEEGHRLLAISPKGGDYVMYGEKKPMFNLRAFVEFRDRQSSFEGVFGGFFGTINVSDGISAQRYDGSFVTHNFGDVLRVEPVLGRGFTAADGRFGASPVILLSHAAWLRDFAGDGSVLGRDVLINSRPGRIIGVMPPGFQFPQKEDAWMALADEYPVGGEWPDQMVMAFGRLRDGVDLDLAQIDADAVARSISEQYPEFTNYTDGAFLQSIQRSVIGKETVKVLWVMMTAVVFILLIACANVANLLLARSAARGRELAIRSALGATRRRIIMQLLSESLVLCVLGAAGGVIFAIWTTDWIAGLVKEARLPYWIDFSLDWRILFFVCLVTVASALISGFVPAFKASRLDINSMLKDGGRTMSGLHVGIFTKGLIVIQVSLSFALLVLAGLMLEVTTVQGRSGLPFDPANILGARFGLFAGEYPKDRDVNQFAMNLADRLSATPGVAQASVTTRMEFSSDGEWLFRTLAMQEDEKKNEDDLRAYTESVLPRYFETMETMILAGRDFSEEDTAESQAVVIVNEPFARLHWPEGAVLGRLLGIKRDNEDGYVWATVVGVVPDLQMEGFQSGVQDGSGVYLPLTQKSSRFLTVVLRPDEGTDSRSLVPILRRAVHEIDPDLPLYWNRTLQESIDLTLAGNRIVTTMFVWFGLAALFLAAMGIFAVVTFSVNQRKTEIGIRMALGARVSDIKALVVRQGFLQLLAGLAIGTLVSLVLGSVLRSAVISVRPHDVIIFLLSIVILTLVTTAAWILPVRKAARVDPMIALRDE